MLCLIQPRESPLSPPRSSPPQCLNCRIAENFLESAEDQARSILEMCKSSDAQILVKKPDGITCYRIDKTDVRTSNFDHEALEAREVKDATGAGDVFAAGLLSVIAYLPLQTELGARLGMKLAKHKLKVVGSLTQRDFVSIRREFCNVL
jgi:hypothetical protein